MNAARTLLYMGVMHGLFTYYLPYRLAQEDQALFDPGPLRLLAPVAWIFGSLVILWCSAVIVRGGGTPAHLDPPRRLLLDGPYRLTRNPIYAGALLVQFGYILWSGSGWTILYNLFCLFGFHILIVLIEEPVLRHTYGDAYEEYRRQVPRWIPKLSRNHS